MHKIEKIINLKISSEKDLEGLKKVLLKIKWFKGSSLEKLTLINLEKAYRKIVKKFPARISYIQQASDKAWAFQIRREDNFLWLNTIYAESIEEGLIKVILTLYAHFVLGIKFKTDRGEARE